MKIDGYECHICTAAIDCSCEHFEEPYVLQFAKDIDKAKHERLTIYERCIYILTRIPQTRNASEKTFGKIYNEIWHGAKIRKSTSNLTSDVWDRSMPSDTINREKRRAKVNHPNLQTYDPKVLKQQTVLFQAYMELAAEQ